MNKIVMIEERILKLDPANYERFATHYLLSKYKFEFVNRIGIKYGESKTTKGVPDAYVISNNTYYLIMHSTSKDFTNKINNDLNAINKYIIDNKIDNQNIKIIITTTQKIKFDWIECFNKKNSNVDIVTLDMISNDIIEKFHFLAHEYLNLNIYSSFLLDKIIFPKEYEKIKKITFSNPYVKNQNFENIKKLLDEKNIIIISGNIGSGKTRISFEISKLYYDYEQFYLINSSNEVINELISIMKSSKKLLIYIDDIHKMDNICNFFQLLVSTENNIILIATTNNFYIEKIRNDLIEFKNFYSIYEMKNLNFSEMENVVNTFLLNNTEAKKIIKNVDGNISLALHWWKHPNDCYENFFFKLYEKSFMNIFNDTENYFYFFISFIFINKKDNIFNKKVQKNKLKDYLCKLFKICDNFKFNDDFTSDFESFLRKAENLKIINIDENEFIYSLDINFCKFILIKNMEDFIKKYMFKILDNNILFLDELIPIINYYNLYFFKKEINNKFTEILKNIYKKTNKHNILDEQVFYLLERLSKVDVYITQKIILSIIKNDSPNIKNNNYWKKTLILMGELNYTHKDNFIYLKLFFEIFKTNKISLSDLKEAIINYIFWYPCDNGYNFNYLTSIQLYSEIKKAAKEYIENHYDFLKEILIYLLNISFSIQKQKLHENSIVILHYHFLLERNKNVLKIRNFYLNEIYKNSDQKDFINIFLKIIFVSQNFSFFIENDIKWSINKKIFQKRNFLNYFFLKWIKNNTQIKNLNIENFHSYEKWMKRIEDFSFLINCENNIFDEILYIFNSYITNINHFINFSFNEYVIIKENINNFFSYIFENKIKWNFSFLEKYLNIENSFMPNIDFTKQEQDIEHNINEIIKISSNNKFYYLSFIFEKYYNKKYLNIVENFLDLQDSNNKKTLSLYTILEYSKFKLSLIETYAKKITEIGDHNLISFYVSNIYDKDISNLFDIFENKEYLYTFYTMINKYNLLGSNEYFSKLGYLLIKNNPKYYKEIFNDKFLMFNNLLDKQKMKIIQYILYESNNCELINNIHIEIYSNENFDKYPSPIFFLKKTDKLNKVNIIIDFLKNKNSHFILKNIYLLNDDEKINFVLLFIKKINDEKIFENVVFFNDCEIKKEISEKRIYFYKKMIEKLKKSKFLNKSYYIIRFEELIEDEIRLLKLYE